MQTQKHYSRAPITEAFLESTRELDYNPVPPKRSQRVTMRALFKGRRKPLPYIRDEE